MRVTGAKAVLRVTLFLTAGAALSACTTAQNATPEGKPSAAKTAKLDAGGSKQVYTYTAKDRDCLKRAMYFESQRTSTAGFLAVGSVIMNRLTSGIYPPTICGVVSQEKQFAPGVMTRSMDQATAPDLEQTATEVLKGKRHPDVKEAMFFHQKGLRFAYTNMHYTAVAGGNVFYEKRGEDGQLQTAEPKPVDQYVLAYADPNAPQTGIASALAAAAETPTLPAGPAASATVTTAPEIVTASSAVAGDKQFTPAVSTVAPVITAQIAKASVAQAFDASFAPTQIWSEPQAGIVPASLATRIPVPLHRPDAQNGAGEKRSGTGTRLDLRSPNPA
jgi:spore germination cell wall hydrolase CwlJ-like protein